MVSTYITSCTHLFMVRYLKFAQLFWNALLMAIFTFLSDELRKLGLLSFKLFILWSVKLSSYPESYNPHLPPQWAHTPISTVSQSHAVLVFLWLAFTSFSIMPVPSMSVLAGCQCNGRTYRVFSPFIHFLFICWETLAFFPFTHPGIFFSWGHLLCLLSRRMPSLLFWL